MSRPKLEKLLKNESPLDQLEILRHGDLFKRNKGMFGYVAKWKLLHGILEKTEPTARRAIIKQAFPKSKVPSDAMPFDLRDEALGFLEFLMEALETGNARFFRDLADVIEGQAKEWTVGGSDKVRDLILSECFKPTGIVSKQKRKPRLVELRNLIEKRLDLYPDDAQIRRTCREIGVKLAPSNRGRPRKSDKLKFKSS